MNRFTRAERLALLVLMALILLTTAVRWWNTRQSGRQNRESLPLAPPPTSETADAQPITD